MSGFTKKMPYRLRTAYIALLFVMTMVMCFGSPGQALALWPVDGEGSVLVGFHESYTSSTGEHTHYGVDCSASAGSAVYTPVSGTVSFVGSVPAGDTEGCGTTTAISIKMDDGNTLTLMPIDTQLVQEGDLVSTGQSIGTLAATGDKSSSATHLHVGLKNGSTYMDPSYLLGLEDVTSSGDTTENTATVLAVEADELVEQLQEVTAGETAVVADVTTAAETVTDTVTDADSDYVADTSTSAESMAAEDADLNYSISSTLASGTVPEYSTASGEAETSAGLAAISEGCNEFLSGTVSNLKAFYSNLGIPAWALWAMAASVAVTLACMLGRQQLQGAAESLRSFGRRTIEAVRER